ncbi:hypothetical protein L7F22_003011 [Adiantum nelumboides]|nr:hypothetical protein [Adiantum nelumboides]
MTVSGKTTTTANGLAPNANNSINAIPEYTIPTVQRISYVLPNVERPPRYFALPTLSQANEGPAYVRSGPLLLPHPEEEALLSGTQSVNKSSNSHPRHSLPISSLAIDTSTIVQNTNAPGGILYAGGRDGMISAWDLDLPMRKKSRRNRMQHDEMTDYDEEATAGLLDDHWGQSESRFGRFHSYSSTREWEVDTSGLYDGHTNVRPATFRQCIGSHTDWVNEILLCNQNQTVVSASSDGNVNIWNPHDKQSSMTPQILGTHKDYVRALTLAKNANWVASGSFDKTIKLWDIGEVRHSPIITLPESSVKSSIYTLSTNSTGTVMAGGSPERIIRIWDPRSGDQISQLVGHTDTVRKVVMSEDGSHMLSASSDSTIKLWSLGEQRCLHTFTHHTDSVWSLFSDHPRLDIFYSGDRSGLICKVDWERCNEVSEGECVVLAKDADVDEGYKFASESNASGIHSLVSTDDSFIWSANANGKISRWLDVASKSARESIYPLVQPAPLPKKVPLQEPASPPNPRISALRGASGNIVPSTSSVSFADPFGASPSIKSSTMHSPDVNQDLTHTDSSSVDKLYGIPFDSLVCLAPPNDPYGAAIGLGSISMRAASRAATPHETDTIFTSASLISIPSVLRQQSQSQSQIQTIAGRSEEQSYDTAPSALLQQQQYHSFNQHSYPSVSNATSPPMGYPFSSHLRDATARPSSVRSGSLRFAPTTTQHSYPDGLAGEAERDEELDNEQDNEAALEARLAFEERELAIDAVPLRDHPQDVIHGTHGLIRSSLLNDRRHCLTINAAGLTYLWDIAAGQCLGAFTWSDLNNAAKENDINTDLLPGEALDVIKGRIQGHSAAPIWCTVDTKIGALSIHLEYPRCFDSEIYLDECEELFHYSDPYFAYKEDQRVNKGRMILKNLFAGFVQQETQLRSNKNAILPNGLLALERKIEVERTLKEGSKEEISVIDASGRRIALAVGPKTPAIVPIQSPLSPTNTHHLSELQRLMYTKHANQTSSASAHGAAIGDYFSIQRATDQPGSAVQTPMASKSAESPVTPGITAVSPGGGGFMGKLRMGLRREGTVSKKPPKTPTGAGNHGSLSNSKESETGNVNGSNDSQDGLTQETRQQLLTLRTILTSISSNNQLKDLGSKSTANQTSPVTQSDIATSLTPRRKWMEEIPIIQYPPETALIISESAHDSGSFQTKYRGLVGKTQEDIITLELQSPIWLLENLFDYKDASGIASYDILRDKDKLTFILVPWEGPSLSSSQITAEKDTIGSPLEDSLKNKLPGMPTGNSRLTATRMLRTKKACAYVADKLHLIEISQDEDNKTVGNVSGNGGNTSGFSSIVASRRPSAIVTENQSVSMSGTSQPTVSPSTNPAQSSPVQSHNPFTRAFSMAKGGLQSNGFSQSARSTQGVTQPAQNLQLRRPSAISIASSGAISSKSAGWVMPYGSTPHDYLELLCRDQIIPPTMTLAQIHRFIWKSGAAIKLEYRWRSGIAQIDTEGDRRGEI